MDAYLSLALTAHGPPSILEPLAPSFRTTTTTTTTTTTSTTTALPPPPLSATTALIHTIMMLANSTSGSSTSHHHPANGSTNNIWLGGTLWHEVVLNNLSTALTNATLHGLHTTAASVTALDHAAAMLSTTTDPETANTTDLAGDLKKGPRFSISSMVIMGIIAAVLSILTVLGNVMVMVSFKIDKQLQTISNYFLFSLAIADFAIGLISMPLFAVTTILGYWPLGPHICDTWLALDYLASNASVLNLLIISFDRYFSVTRPLTYRAKRTTTRAALMIALAWGISLLLWPPWIYSWPYIEGKRTVPEHRCYIQFIETNQYITFGTALAAFYLPVTIMCFLYFRIWRETKKRQKDLPNLQAGKKDSSKRSNSSDENTVVNHTGGLLTFGGGGGDHETWRRPRSESSADAESVYMTNMVIDSGYHGMHSRKSSIKSTNTINKKSYSCFGGIKEWCIAWWHSGREDSDDFNYEQEEPSDLGYATPVSIETPLQSSVTRCTSMNVMRDTYSLGGSVSGSVRPPSILLPDVSPTPLRPQQQTATSSLAPLSQLQEIGGGPGPGGGASSSMAASSSLGRDSRQTASGGSQRIGSRSVSQDSVYTILIRLPSDSGGAAGGGGGGGGGGGSSATSNGGAGSVMAEAPSIKMIHEDVPMPLATMPPPMHAHGGHQTAAQRRPLASRDSEYSLPTMVGGGNPRRMSHAANADMRIPLNAKIIPKQLAGGAKGGMGFGHFATSAADRHAAKKKKKSQEKRQESKAAKTLSAILLSFIITWTPYNILVLIKPLTTCEACIPAELWDFFYALCYINSTINPMCYALCNASFRRTYIRILTCKWHARNREGMVRGVYN